MAQAYHNRRLGEPARFRLTPAAGGVGLLTASYHRQVFAPHAHATWTFAIVRRGAMNVHIGGSHDRLDASSIIVIPPGVIHAATPAERDGWDYVSIYPTVAAVDACLEALAPMQASRLPQGVIRSRRLAGLCDRLAERLSTDDAAIPDALQRLVEGVWHATPGRRRVVTEPVACIERARAYIEDHACERLTLDAMATVAGLSPFHFMRRFHQVVGATPYAFYIQRRVDRARTMLEQGASIIETAYGCGFVDQSHLNRHFKRIIGVTPGAYLAGLPGRRAVSLAARDARRPTSLRAPATLLA